MGKMMRLSGLLVLGAVFAFANQAQAGYVVSVEGPGGSSTADVRPGDSISLDVVLTGNSVHIANEFAVTFSRGGLILTNFAFGSPYITDGGDDTSVPQLTDLPVTLADDTFGLPGSDVDAKFSNFLGTGNFGTGSVLSFDLDIPVGYAEGVVDISVGNTSGSGNPSFLGTFVDEPIDGINGFALNVVPEPATLALLGVGGLVAVMRRRRKA